MTGGKILLNHADLFSHIFGTLWVRECGCKLSNKRVQKPHCLSQPCPLLFFFPPPRLDLRCLPTQRLMSPSPSCATAHLISHTNLRKHTPRCCGSEMQPECDRTLLRYASRKIAEGCAPPIDTQNAPLHLQSLLTIRKESRLSTSSLGSHLKIESSHTYSCVFPPNKDVSLFSHRLVTGEQAHGAGRYNQRCTPNQQQTWGITSFTCMRKSALFMNKLLLLRAAISQMIMLSRWPLQAVAGAIFWLQFVYFIILQRIYPQAVRCFLPFMLLQLYNMVASIGLGYEW